MKIIRMITLFTSLIAPIIAPYTMAADSDTIYVIVNQKSELSELNKKQVMSIFLGRARNFPNGKTAKAFDHGLDSAIREAFFERLTGKQLSDIDAYWARLSYSGRAFPPKSISNVNGILEEVGRNKNAISYVKDKSPEELSEQGIVIVYSIKGR
tara:strand:+ start:57342 stop:57803 length:462 start_codon:yes stop_codon:yes gene_type:complete